MESSQVKKAFRDAEQEHEKDQVDALKKVIKATLEKLETLKKDRAEYIAKIDKKIDVLKRDVEDFKSGRLDRINERQEKDKDAKETSVVRIERIIEIERYYARPWYEPYKIIWNSVGDQLSYPVTSSPYNFGSVTVSSNAANGTSLYYVESSSGASGTSAFQESFTLTGKVSSVHAGGAYPLANGVVKNI